ncbi:hypothetical protein [Thaumasiovibrio subtropicus]|uniref:hypothetical protein n=2 Tax=Thaumasiovibrio subtropicus TaxID=1891207 RepID=UPI001C863BA2|nr:hypothetical protein [Thaumasiovibrio subtropicus]
MSNTIRNCVIAIVGCQLYLLWSLFTITELKQALAEEKLRSQNIAADYQMWRELWQNHSAPLSIERLLAHAREPQLTEVDFSRANQRAYVMTLNEPVLAEQLQRYRSDHVLSPYFYVITDEEGAIIDWFWDKP